MEEVRCKRCHHLLMKAEYGKVEIKCRSCGYLNHLVLVAECGKPPMLINRTQGCSFELRDITRMVQMYI